MGVLNVQIVAIVNAPNKICSEIVKIKMSTKLSLQIDNEIISWEVPHNDCNTEELSKGFLQVLLGSTFYKESILKGMKKVLDDEFDIENTQYIVVEND